MIVTEVVPRTLASADVSTDDGREWLRERYARTEDAYVRLNMITSLTGSAAGSDGTSESLTSRVDRAILGVIRAAADVVVVGAQSVRAEGYVVPRSSRLAIVTSSGDLTGHRLSLGPDATPDRVLLVCPAAIAADLAARTATPRRPGRARARRRAPRASGDRRGPRRRADSAASCARAARRWRASSRRRGSSTSTASPSRRSLEPADRPFLSAPSRPDTEVAGALVDESGFSYLRLRRAGLRSSPSTHERMLSLQRSWS